MQTSALWEKSTMPWKINYLETEQIVETFYEGNLSGAEVRKAAKASLTMGLEKNTHLFLGNCTTLQPSRSLFDIYEIAKFLLELKPSRLSKEAILLPDMELSANQMRFYETLGRNRGFEIRVFNDREQAIQWLKADQD